MSFIGLNLNGVHCPHCNSEEDYVSKDVVVEKDSNNKKDCYIICKKCGEKMFFSDIEDFIEPKFKDYSIVKNRINPKNKQEILGTSYSCYPPRYLTSFGNSIYIIDQDDWELCNEEETKMFKLYLKECWPACL